MFLLEEAMLSALWHTLKWGKVSSTFPSDCSKADCDIIQAMFIDHSLNHGMETSVTFYSKGNKSDFLDKLTLTIVCIFDFDKLLHITCCN